MVYLGSVCTSGIATGFCLFIGCNNAYVDPSKLIFNTEVFLAIYGYNNSQ